MENYQTIERNSHHPAKNQVKNTIIRSRTNEMNEIEEQFHRE